MQHQEGGGDIDTLEYLVRLRGAAAASAQMRRLAAETKAAGSEAAGVSRLGGAAGVAAKGIAAIGIAAVGIGFEAVKMSTSFNHEMLRIRTDAGATSGELRNMKSGVLDLARSGASMGQGPMSLAQGLYHLESLGIRGSRALSALKLASQEAAISGANLEQTTTALGAAMYVGIKGTGNLTQLMGTLNATVGAGNMRFQDLVDALGTGVLSSAKVAGLSIQDVSSALAVLTDSGMQASSASAQLATALHFLYAPSTKAAAAMKSIGLPATRLAEDMHKPRGLLVALTDLHNHLRGLSDVAKAQVLNAILPGGRGRVLLTELTMLDRLKGKYDQINRTAGGFQGSVAAQRHDPGTQLRIGEARAQANLIGLGNVLSPIVIPALTALLAVGSKVLLWLTHLVTSIEAVVGWFKKHRDVAIALGIGLGILVVAFTAWRAALALGEIALALATGEAWSFNIALLANPIVLVIVAIAALVAAVVYCWLHFKTFRDIVTGVWDWLKGAATDATQWVINAFNNVVNFFAKLPGAIAKIGSNLWQGLKGDLVAVVNWIIGIWNGMPFIHGFHIGPLWIPGLPTITPIGGPPAGTPARPRGLGFAPPKGFGPHSGAHGPAPHQIHHAADVHAGLTIHATFDHPIVIDGHQVAHVVRRQIIKAQAANA